MIDRTSDAGRPGGAARRPNRRPRRRPSRPRRAPGTPFAAALALVLGVSAAAWWAAREAPPAFAIGTAATITPTPLGGTTHATLPRGERGEPRSLPDGRSGRAAPDTSTSARTGTPPAGPAAAPARTLVPTRTRSSAGSPTAASASASGSGAAATVADEVLRLTNVERAKAGCGPLHADSRLAAAAQEHSSDMATRGYFSHVTPDGLTPWDRARAAGYTQPSAENIAMGYRTPADVMAAWMQSAGHRANILNCASHALGVGFDARGYYWTQLFGYV
jgi:uncharacterized protein YkwD